MSYKQNNFKKGKGPQSCGVNAHYFNESLSPVTFVRQTTESTADLS